MKTWRQVLHVAHKDVRFSRRLLFVYAAAVAAAAAGWRLGVDAFNTYSWLWGMGVLFLAMTIAALFVLEDSPVRREQLWATVPLTVWGLFWAKLVTAAVALVAVGLAGQALALTTFSLPPVDLMRVLAGSGTTVGVALLFAMLMGSLARDTRMAALLLVLVPIVSMVGSILLWNAVHGSEPAGDRISPAMPVVLLVSLAGLLAHQYVTRRTGRTALLAVVAAVALVLASPLQEVGPTTAVDDVVLRIDSVVPDPVSPGLLHLVLSVSGADPTLRYEARRLRVHLTGADGGSHSLHVASPFIVLAMGSVPDTAGLRRLNVWTPAESLDGLVRLMPTAAQRAALSDGEAWLEITGTLVSLVPEARRPILISRRGADVVPGERVRILGVEETGPGTEVRLEILTVGRKSAQWQATGDRPLQHVWNQHLLVHRGRNEVTPYAVRGWSSGLPPLIVLPGAGTSRQEIVLSPADWDPPGAEATRPSRQWVEAAELVLIHWTERDARPFRVTAGASPGQAVSR